MPAPGDRLTLTIERPAVGGRMIARLDGAIVLVAGAIPGERVEAVVERTQRGTVFARTAAVLDPSPDRVPVDAGLAAAGHVFAHVSGPRQASLKAEMVADAFRRLGRVEIGAVPVETGPADGYRTRARVHLRRGRWGFFEEGTHELCDIAAARQLSVASAAVLDAVCADVAAVAGGRGAEVAWAESVDGRQRVAHVHLDAGGGRRIAPRDQLDGLWWSDASAPLGALAWGRPVIVDDVRVSGGALVPLRHHVRSFFQGNRFLLQALVDEVVRRVRGDAVADLYAGVGLFAAAAAAEGRSVLAVEGDRWSAVDLLDNASRRPGVTAVHAPVERVLTSGRAGRADTVIVDPPRAGLGAGVVAALATMAPARLVYVSCDPATLARDTRAFVAAGFELSDVRVFDLFPRTAHVETVVTLDR